MHHFPYLCSCMAYTRCMSPCYREHRLAHRGTLTAVHQASMRDVHKFLMTLPLICRIGSTMLLEVRGLRRLGGDSKRGRDALGTSQLRILKQLAALPSSVSTVLLLQELGQRPLLHAWWAAHGQVLELTGRPP